MKLLRHYECIMQAVYYETETKLRLIYLFKLAHSRFLYWWCLSQCFSFSVFKFFGVKCYKHIDWEKKLSDISFPTCKSILLLIWHYSFFGHENVTVGDNLQAAWKQLSAWGCVSSPLLDVSARGHWCAVSRFDACSYSSSSLNVSKASGKEEHFDCPFMRM